jgi:hypothetical protein
VAGSSAGKTSSAVRGIDVRGPPRAGAWCGPCSPRRKSPPAVLGQFLAAAASSPGRRKATEPPLVQTATGKAGVTLHDGGPDKILSWAGLGQVM